MAARPGRHRPPPTPGGSVLIDQAMRMLGVSRRTVYYWIRQGRLRTVRTRLGSQRVLLDSIRDLGTHAGGAAVPEADRGDSAACRPNPALVARPGGSMFTRPGARRSWRVALALLAVLVFAAGVGVCRRGPASRPPVGGPRAAPVHRRGRAGGRHRVGQPRRDRGAGRAPRRGAEAVAGRRRGDPGHARRRWRRWPPTKPWRTCRATSPCAGRWR